MKFQSVTSLALLLCTCLLCPCLLHPRGLAQNPAANQLEFDTPTLSLKGSDARAQALVRASSPNQQSSSAILDLTRNVRFEPSHPGIISVDANGLITPLASGTLTLTATADGYAPATAQVAVELNSQDDAVNFPNQIVPIFTKFGCNGGGCHGKIAGQNGFRLSLLGSEPAEDYEHLVRESRGRRLFPAAPDTSLLLTKSIGSVPHGGGQRMNVSLRNGKRHLVLWDFSSSNPSTVAKVLDENSGMLDVITFSRAFNQTLPSGSMPSMPWSVSMPKVDSNLSPATDGFNGNQNYHP